LRALGEAKSAAHRMARVGGGADLVVIGGAGHREGLSEDHLTVRLRDPAPPRGARVNARLELDAGALFGRPVAE